MGNSDRWKPGSEQPGGNSPPAGSAAANSKSNPPADGSAQDKAVGRIIHDERGNAVWDWVKDTARIAIDSTTRLLMRLDVPELQVEDTEEQRRKESERDSGGGYDPYGGSASTPARNAAPDRTSGAQKARGTGGGDSAGPRRGTFGNRSTTGGEPRSTPNNADGGYDPYGKGVTNKPTRKP